MAVTISSALSEADQLRINAITSAFQSMKVGSTILPALETLGLKAYIATDFVAGDFTDAAATSQHGQGGFPVNVVPVAAIIVVNTEFEGGTASAVTLSAGNAADPDGLCDPVSVFAGDGDGPKTSVITNATFLGAFQTAFVPVLQMTATGDTCDNVGVGDATLIILYRDISSLVA